MKRLLKSRFTTLLAVLPICALLMGGCFGGCQAPPQRVAYNVVSAPVVTTETVMGMWGDYVKQFHPPLDQELAVLKAYNKAKAAELASIDSAHAAAQATSSTNSPTSVFLSLPQSPEAAQALSELIDLVKSFGVKL
jgi:23S rRNA pseudoU1915 N3-methylase RlmH